VTNDEELARYLEMEPPDLLAEIAIASDPDAPLYSPDALLAKGRAVVTELLPQIQDLVCPHQNVLDGPEAQVALAISGFLLGGVPGAVIQPLAVYIVKRGLRRLCGDWMATL
jgi:hypothetical protein